MPASSFKSLPSSFYAHTKKCLETQKTNPNKSSWEPLFTPLGVFDPDDPSKACSGKEGHSCPHCQSLHPRHGHLNKVAYLTSGFAADLFQTSADRSHAAQWGYYAGLWHDLGKFSIEFQELLQGNAHSVDHSTAGAQHAVKSIPTIGHLLSYGIAGHHSGLLDGIKNTSCQIKRLSNEDIPSITAAPESLLVPPQLTLPPGILAALKGSAVPAFSASLFTRLLYSCLIDADFLATEAFMNPTARTERNQVPGTALQDILFQLNNTLTSFGEPVPGDVVNTQRAKVLHDCTAAAQNSTGLFTLTVPTGGGKTLSSLKFALEHALKHEKKRIIYVLPFTTIIEQNAQVFRRIVLPLQTDKYTPLVEHHSSFPTDKDTPQSRLASENWDAPLIITTSVQFYESLFASKTSSARKVHNIANSVIILDEAQTLPVNHLKPCLVLLQELADTYHTTTVLCTATQPAINYAEDFPIGLKNTKEIIQDTRPMFAVLKRVTFQNRGHLSDDELSDELNSHQQVLCIVNRRLHAHTLYNKLSPSEANFHLSALMCPAHRSKVISVILNRLANKQPARVISTQLIEAGVDIDFPVVYRALAGLDSIAQAAGRCNRNGTLDKLGITHVFRPEDQAGETYFRETAQVANQLLELHDDLLGQDAIRHYFDLYYYQQKSRWDSQGILDHFHLARNMATFPFHFDFATVAQKFRLIEDWQVPVIIPYDRIAEELIQQLRNESIPLHRKLLRSLQRYTVQVPPRLLNDNIRSFESLRDAQFHVLISPELHYCKFVGLTLDKHYANSQFLIS